MNKKGQALVEFVLLIPIIIMIICIIVDFSMIFYNKNHLEGVLDDTVTYVKSGKTNEEIKKLINDNDITLSIKISNNTATIKIAKSVKLITPFSKTFFDNPYKIDTERVIIYE